MLFDQDADLDKTDKADQLQALMGVYRRKSASEIEEEVAAIVASEIDILPALTQQPLLDSESPHIDRFREVDRVTVVLTEVPVQKAYRDPTETATADAEGESGDEGEAGTEPDSPPADNTCIQEFFGPQFLWSKRMRETLKTSCYKDFDTQYASLTTMNSIWVKPLALTSEAQCIEGNLGGVRIFKTEIDNGVPRQLKTASALTM